MRNPLRSRPIAARARSPDGRVEDGDLLPNLARQSRGEVLHVGHGFQHDRVLQVLDVQRRHLAGEREQVGAIIQVAGQVGPGHATVRRHLELLPSGEELVLNPEPGNRSSIRRCTRSSVSTMCEPSSRRYIYGRYSCGMGCCASSSNQTAAAIHHRVPSQNSSMLLIPRPTTGPSGARRSWYVLKACTTLPYSRVTRWISCSKKPSRTNPESASSTNAWWSMIAAYGPRLPTPVATNLTPGM